MAAKKKFINDPIYGFITINSTLIFDLIEHPVFQRLRRISQMGLAKLVYPSASHTRFQHAMGAMHLMERALEVLESKGVEISKEEKEAAMIAILLHDIGHGPFSHALEKTLLKNAHHEELSILLMEYLNEVFDGKITLAIEIFLNKYPRRFFHELVSSQLDTDRLDYLQRDCFFTGVREGRIGVDRIIYMLDVVDDKIVIEEKGIYSVENFLNTRRLMYWQVYLHKTCVGAEQMLILMIKRAKYLVQSGVELICTPALKWFLDNDFTIDDFKADKKVLEQFSLLDDSDVWGSMKFWLTHTDDTLRRLTEMLLFRKTFRCEIIHEPPKTSRIEELKIALKEAYGLNEEEVSYLWKTGMVSNAAYVKSHQTIWIKRKTGELEDIVLASDLPNIEALSKIVQKYYLCYPKVISLRY